MGGSDPKHALAVLLELTRRLSAHPSLAHALQMVTDAALDLLPADHASVRVLDGEGAELLSGARSGAGVQARAMTHVRGVGIAGWVVERGKVARIDDVWQDERWLRHDEQGFVIRSMLAVPLWSAGTVIGVVATSSPRVRMFTADHELLIALLANCAVPPIERARLARLAMTDAQTRAYNQGFLLPGIQTEMNRSRKLSLLLMDLDHFKAVNDRFGHAAGDTVLAEFAERIRRCTRDHDILVRRGGDEFVLIMPGADKGNALQAADRIRTEVRDHPVILDDGTSVELSVSVGAAMWNGKETPQQLEKRTDVAMYEAKQGGRDQVSWGGGSDIPPSSDRARVPDPRDPE
ncbi:MAG: sensor domain-containing diguanylate cyclase [Myxococcota bacterium]